MEQNPMDIFNLNIEDFKEEKTQSKSSNLYKPNPADGADGNYRAQVRFLPNHRDIRNSYIKKFTYWLTDSEGNGGYFDSPKSISWDERCPIFDLYMKLSRSKSALDQKAAEKLSRKEYYFSLVQIIKDPQNPDLEGTIQIYRYPKTIRKILEACMEPSQEDIEMGAEPCNYFDLFEGKIFNIKVTTKAGYWNYDECKFVNSTSPLKIDGVAVEKTPESQKKVLEYLETGPDLSQFKYTPLSEEKTAQLSRILADIDPSGTAQAYSNIAQSQSTSKTLIEDPVSTVVDQPSADETSSDSMESDLDDFLNDL